jgi:4-amino-4-deoxy-L-arabinose transferase-like glycosyltransferase
MTGEPVRAGRRFWPWLVVWTLVGLGIRLATVYGRPHRTPGGDPGYAHGVADLIVAGKGFINPLAYNFHNQHHVLQTAGWPPLWTMLLTVPIFFGFHSFFAARIWSCIIGAVAVTVCGLAGREVAGRRVGLITALIIAVYPNIWMNVELASSETLSPLLVGLILWTAYRFWHRSSWGNMVALGVSIGLGALGRDELALLWLFILVPLVLSIRSSTWRRRFGLLLAGAAASAFIVFPWVGYNMSRFDQVVTISDGLGPTLLSSNCGVTYSGPFEGYWSWQCVEHVKDNPKVDESVNFAHDQKLGISYIKAHKSELPRVTLARVGRGFGFYHPLQQVQLDSVVETRPYHWGLVGLGMYYALLALSIGGTVVLKRRKILVYPLLAVGLDVLFVFVLSFGQTRYRVTFEVSLAILASVQLEWLWSTLSRTPGHRIGKSAPVDDPDGQSPTPASEPEPAELIGGGIATRS